MADGDAEEATMPTHLPGQLQHGCEHVRCDLRLIVPLCLVSFFSGLVQSLATEWGLFRHWWIVVKFGLTTVSTMMRRSMA